MDRCSHPRAAHGAQGCRINGCPCRAELGLHDRVEPRVPVLEPLPAPVTHPWLLPLTFAAMVLGVAVGLILGAYL